MARAPRGLKGNLANGGRATDNNHGDLATLASVEEYRCESATYSGTLRPASRVNPLRRLVRIYLLRLQRGISGSGRNSIFRGVCQIYPLIHSKSTPILVLSHLGLGSEV